MDPRSEAYRKARLAIVAAVTAQCRRIWAATHDNREECTGAIVEAVEAGQAQMVALVDAYMAMRVGVEPQGLDPSKYTVAQLRGVPAEEVYGRPWGAFYVTLEEGDDGTVPRGSAGGAGQPRPPGGD